MKQQRVTDRNGRNDEAHDRLGAFDGADLAAQVEELVEPDLFKVALG